MFQAKAKLSAQEHSNWDHVLFQSSSTGSTVTWITGRSNRPKTQELTAPFHLGILYFSTIYAGFQVLKFLCTLQNYYHKPKQRHNKGPWAAVSNDRLPTEPPSDAHTPSHQWSPVDILYLEEAFSPTSSRATSRQTHKTRQRRCALKGAGNTTVSGWPTPPAPFLLSGPKQEGFRAPWSMGCFTSTWPISLKPPELLSSR